MRSATLMTMLAATLLLAACDASEETGTMPMASEDMPMEDTMSMDAEDMPMTQSGEAGRTASAAGRGVGRSRSTRAETSLARA